MKGRNTLYALLLCSLFGSAHAAEQCPVDAVYKVGERLYRGEDIRQVTDVVDFSLSLTEKGSFLKLYEIDFEVLPFPQWQLPEFQFNPRDEPMQTPDICELYEETFSPLAAQCACAAYIEASRHVSHPFQAVLIGHGAGREFERSGVCTAN